MRKIIKLTLSYIRFYKGQTFSMLLGIILSAMLISGIGSLFYSGQKADLENVRTQYGDWHFQIIDKTNSLDKKLTKAPSGPNYTVEKYGLLKIKKIIEEPYQVTFCFADENYMQMLGRTLIKGNYPKNSNDIALDYYTINNLGLTDQIGASVKICGNSYILSGILSDGPDDSTGDMKVFVNDSTVMDNEILLVYLKFNENQKVLNELKSFIKAYGIDIQTVRRNNDIAEYVGGVPSISVDSIIETVKITFSSPGTEIFYLLGSLNQSSKLVSHVVFFALALFGSFIIYSLYSITLTKRKAEYSILQVIGLEEKHLLGLILTELLLIFIVGYPLGCLAGNGIARLLYSNIGYIFSHQSEGTAFFVSITTILHGALFFFCFIVLISFMIIRQMRQQTESQRLHSGFSGERKNRKIYAKHSKDLTQILTKRFMFGKPSTFIGIIISLSLGGILFLSTTYVAKCAQINMNHSLQTDDGLGYDMSVYIDSANGSYSIPGSAVKQIKNIEGIAKADEMSYLLGEIPLEKGILKWTSFYPELDNNPKHKQSQAILDHYHGIIRKQGLDCYRLKVNVYGYNDDMLNALNDYLVDGTINPSTLRKENSIILKTLTDGQGNTDALDIKIGDTIKLKVPKTMNLAELLKFEGDGSQYIEKEFTVAAIVNRPLAKNDYFIGDNGVDSVDIIMSCEQMHNNFNINNYNTISINLNDKINHRLVSQQIHSAIAGINRCMLKDYTEKIRQKNIELTQKVWFFYGIAAILLCISLLHIINSMKHIVLSRRHEFGIIRAMGITNQKFQTMMLREGIRYGIYTSIFMFIVYLIIHQVLNVMMKRVFLYIIVDNHIMLPQYLFMIILNLLICIVTLTISGNSILKEAIVKEI